MTNGKDFINYILNLFAKKPVKRYPMPDRSNIIYKKNDFLQYCIGGMIFLLILASCTPKAYLSNGCKYKVTAPKFNK